MDAIEGAGSQQFHLALSIALHRQIGTWNKHVDRFIALTQYQREMMIHAGLPPEPESASSRNSIPAAPRRFRGLQA
jgi:hypothetical protein